MRKKLKRLLIGAGILVAVLGVLYTLALIRAQARLRRAYAALKADGRPMQVAEIIPPSVAETENAAPLFIQAATLLKDQPSGIRDLLDRLQTLSTRYLRDRIDEEDLEELKTKIDQKIVAEALQLYEKGRQRPQCRFKRDYSSGLRTDLHEVGAIRSLYRIHRVHALLTEDGEDPYESWDSVLDHLRLLASLREEPVFWNQISRYAMVSRVCQRMHELCKTHPPNRQMIQKLDQALRELDDITPIILALDAERLLKGDWLFKLPMDKLFSALYQDGLLGETPNTLSRLSFAYIKFKPRLVADHAAYLEWMRKSTHFLQAPYDVDINQAWRGQIDGAFLANQIRPIVSYGKRIYCDIAALTRITRAGLALLQYKVSHGDYPTDLDVLGLENLTDPYSQKALRYIVQDETFSLYSVGKNQQDNEGKPYERKHKEYDDIAWHVPPLSQRTVASHSER